MNGIMIAINLEGDTMKTNKFLLFALLISGLLLLSACLPATATDEPQEPPAENTPYPNPAQEDLGQEDDTVVEMPYPNPEEAGEGVVGERFPRDPYPALEVVASASDVDRSQAVQPSDFAPQADDEKLVVGKAFIERNLIVVKEGSTGQAELLLIGNLPTPCNSLRVVQSETDADGKISVSVYSVSDPDEMCIQVLQPFTAVFPLEGLAKGEYNLSINNEPVGKFQIP
jgi:hypothetical protein